MREMKLREAGYLYRLDTELYRAGEDADVRMALASLEKEYMADPERWITESLNISAELTTFDTTHMTADEADFPLTRKSLAFAHAKRKAPIPAGDYYLGDIACIEAELRVLRSLSWHEKMPHVEDIDVCHKPASILFDAAGKPCGYQKASGLPLTYIWRNSDVRTEAGVYRLPADSFVELIYAIGEDPRECYVGKSLIALENARLPQDITFLRFSTASLTIAIQTRGANAVADRAPKLYENVNELAQFEPRLIGNRVRKLLKQERAIRVGQKVSRK
ncbi:MAG: hypothetical protein ACQR33_02340 [Candidatus Saccharibacteria bacterium]